MELFADVSCPFTHVGLRFIVDKRKTEARDDIVLNVRAWPLELVNGEPLDAELVSHKVEALREQVAPHLFAGFDKATFTGSFLPAMHLAAKAYAHDLVSGERVSLALRDALFEHGADLADPGVLASIAEAEGLDPATGRAEEETVLRDWEEGKARGVKGSPHFFIGSTGYFCPSLKITNEDGHLIIEADRKGFDAFIAEAFDER